MLVRTVTKLAGNLEIARRLPGQTRAPYAAGTAIEARRDRRIRDVVRYAARTVPFYREWFARAGADPRDVRGAADLDRLPLLDRDQVRAEPERFVSRTRAGATGLLFATSGTTGTPLRMWHDRRSLLANVAYGERERVVVNQVCGGAFRPTELYVGYETSTFKAVQAFYEAATLLPRPQRRFVSLQEPLDRVADRMDAERPDVLVGYGGWIALFFRTLLARGRTGHLPKAVMSMGEALPPGTRELLEERLGVPVLSRYNAVESFKIGFVCEARRGFHLHEDLCHVRLVDDAGRAVPPGAPGRVILSNLVNRATVLLNYPIGDVATAAEGPCPCGRTFARLADLEGRVEDVLTSADGRAVHPRAVWEIVKREADVLQYQLVQRAPARFGLTLVTLDQGGYARALAGVRPGLERLLGAGATIEAVHGTGIARPEGGKFRAVSVASGGA